MYDNGLELYVNGSSDIWTIRDGVQLPPWGWHARHDATDFVEFSVLKDGRRIDYIYSPEYEYLDGRGEEIVYRGLAAKGSIAVRRTDREIEVIDIYGNDFIGLRVKGPVDCRAYDPEGQDLGPIEARHAQQDMIWLKTVESARKYVLRPSALVDTLGDFSLTFERDTAIPGQGVTAGVHLKASRPISIKSASVELEGFPAAEIARFANLQTAPAKTYAGRVPLVIPKDLKPGAGVWVRARVETADGSVLVSWYRLAIIPAFEISFRELGGRRFQVNVRRNISRSAKISVETHLKSGESGLSVNEDPTKRGVIAIGPPAGLREVEDTLVVTASHGDLSTTEEFPVRTVIDHPVVWKASGREGLQWGQAFRGGEESPGNSQTGASFIWTSITSGGVTKQGIFAHPPYVGGVGYTFGVTPPIAIPNEPCDLRAFIGIKDGGDVSDGVLFKVLALDDAGEHRLVEEFWAKREWKEITADLSAFTGKKIRLKFVTDVGPNDNSIADWASWGEPRIVLKSPVLRIGAG